jgi:branched-chain amino acid transport system ATP-binding protein
MREAEAPEGVLAVRGLRCCYGRAEIIHGIDLDVGRGEIVCLIGANGAGKSTFIKGVMGLIAAPSGRITLCGQDVTRTSTPDRVALGMALVPEGRGVLPQMSVEDNLLMGGYVRRSAAWLPQEKDRVLTLIPALAERRSQAAGTLSGGEQQMLVIGRALMSRPKLLVLDEPSFGLAPKIVDAVFKIVTELQADGLTILLVEQNANIALQVSDRGYVIDSGLCILHDRASNLRDNPIVRDIYLGSN